MQKITCPKSALKYSKGGSTPGGGAL